MKFCAILLLWMASFTAMAQPRVAPIGVEPLAADRFAGYDNFGFAYLIKDNVFCKFKNGRTLEYKNLALGKITRVDLRNPLQIVLFYEPFNTVILVDNQLNETHRVNFSEFPSPIVASAVGMASGNRLWVFNSLTQRIGLFDYLRREYREITVPFAGKIAAYESDFNFFHWTDERGFRFAADVYGKVSQYGPTPRFDQFSVIGTHWLLYSNEGKLYAQSLVDGKVYGLEIGEKTFKSFHCQAQNLAIFTNQGISNYKIILP